MGVGTEVHSLRLDHKGTHRGIQRIIGMCCGQTNFTSTAFMTMFVVGTNLPIMTDYAEDLSLRILVLWIRSDQ